MIRRPPRSTLFPYRRSSDLESSWLHYEIKTFRPDVIISVVAVSLDRKSTRLNSSHTIISYAAFCLKKTPCRSALTRRGSGLLESVGARRLPAPPGHAGGFFFLGSGPPPTTPLSPKTCCCR